jgi:hypothetical protein
MTRPARSKVASSLFVGATAVFALMACRSTAPVTGGGAAPSTSEVMADFTPTGVPLDWGLLQPGVASNAPEALIANAAAKRLRAAAGLAQLMNGFPGGVSIVDGIVSIPVALKPGTYPPFGDGQMNRSLAWNGWDAAAAKSDVPVAAYVAFAAGNSFADRVYVVEASTHLRGSAAPGNELYAQLSTETETGPWMAMARDDKSGVYRLALTGSQLSGRLTATVDYPATLVPAPAWLSVQDEVFGWRRLKVRFAPNADGAAGDAQPFPLLFRFPAQGAEAAWQSLPSDQQKFKLSGRRVSSPPLDFPLGGTVEERPDQVLERWFEELHGSFDRDVIVDGEHAVYVPDQKGGVHHVYPSPEDHDHATTAVGKVITYVVKERPGGTETLYTCFDARNPAAEAQWGVPSGAGWHSIGEPTNGETIVNNFEDTGIFAGWAVETPYPFGGAAPYDAKDVATFRVVRPGEAFTTLRGHLHWYAVDAARKVCVTIWKHGCQPRSERDLACNAP